MTAKPRAVRVEDELWEASVAKSKEQGDNLSALVRAALRQYVEGGNMLAAAFDEGARAGADYQFKLAFAIEQGDPDPEPITNPYRSQA